MEDLGRLAANLGMTEREFLVKLAVEANLPKPEEVATVWQQRLARGDIPSYVAQFLPRACTSRYYE